METYFKNKTQEKPMSNNQVMLDNTGVISAVLLGCVIYLWGGFSYVVLMLLFLFISVWATRYGKEEKKQLGIYEEERGWRNVLSNGLIPALVLLTPYKPELFLAALAAAQADKFASELGVLDPKAPVDLFTLKRVSPGRSGAVSWLGTIMAMAGAVIIGLAGIAVFSISVKSATHIAICGFLGSLADSLAGIAEERGFGSKELSNLIGTFTGALAYYALFVR